MFVINCGLALGFNGSTNNTVPLDQMGPWVQDALDAHAGAGARTGDQGGMVLTPERVVRHLPPHYSAARRRRPLAAPDR